MNYLVELKDLIRNYFFSCFLSYESADKKSEIIIDENSEMVTNWSDFILDLIVLGFFEKKDKTKKGIFHEKINHNNGFSI